MSEPSDKMERELDLQRSNLAMYVRRLVQQIRCHEPDNDVARSAVAYLCMKGLQGSTTRDDEASAQSAAREPDPDSARDYLVRKMLDTLASQHKAVTASTGYDPEKYSSTYSEAADLIRQLDRMIDKLEARCTASATRRTCPYCTSENPAIRSTYYDQTCEGCVKRMGQS